MQSLISVFKKKALHYTGRELLDLRSKVTPCLCGKIYLKFNLVTVKISEILFCIHVHGFAVIPTSVFTSGAMLKRKSCMATNLILCELPLF